VSDLEEFLVDVTFTKSRQPRRCTETLTVYATDPQEAAEEAHDFVSSWDGVTDVQVDSVE
jgi:hypothetical protein